MDTGSKEMVPQVGREPSLVTHLNGTSHQILPSIINKDETEDIYIQFDQGRNKLIPIPWSSLRLKLDSYSRTLP